MFVNVMGTKYKILKKKYSEDPYFASAGCDGYCDFNTKSISICDLSTYPGFERMSKEYCENSNKQTLRHELVHAFLYESGLDSCSNHINSWARNEEMVDWFAIQGPKIYDAWVKAKAI